MEGGTKPLAPHHAAPPARPLASRALELAPAQSGRGGDVLRAGGARRRALDGGARLPPGLRGALERSACSQDLNTKGLGGGRDARARQGSFSI